eukprot:2664756-Prymnesium_polylepis.2
MSRLSFSTRAHAAACTRHIDMRDAWCVCVCAVRGASGSAPLHHAFVNSFRENPELTMHAFHCLGLKFNPFQSSCRAEMRMTVQPGQRTLRGPPDLYSFRLYSCMIESTGAISRAV